MAVYFIQAGDGGPVKIGIADDVASRLASLQTGCPAQLKILRLVRGDRPTEIEMHIRFARQRLRGEWFSFDPEMLSVALPDLPIPAVGIERRSVPAISAVPSGLSPLTRDLIQRAADFCVEHRISEARLATIVAKDGKFFKRVRGGGGLTVEMYERFMRHFDEAKRAA